MSEGFAGDPGHEGGSQPMTSLKGSMEMPFIQSPRESTAQTNPRSAGSDNINQTWNTTVLGSAPAGTSSNDSAAAR